MVVDTPQAKTFWQARVLIVDDEIFVRRLVRRLLSGLSIAEIVEAEDGMEALKLLRKFKPDIVICDYQMPNLNGLELLQVVRGGHEPNIRRDLPIIMLTGDSDSSVFSMAMDLDVDAFVKKPVGKDAFTKKIQRCFSVPQIIKSADFYDAISSINQPTESHRLTFSAETMIEKSIDEVVAGDVLALDLISSTGALLLVREMAISTNSIDRLKDLAEMGEFKFVVVHKNNSTAEPLDDNER